jgi:hypothetical protein
MHLSRDKRFTAFTLPDGRRAGLCTEDRPRCVHGHEAKTNAKLTGDMVINCQHRPPRAGAPPCNATLYVALLHFGMKPVVKGEGDRFWIVIEITGEQAREILRRPMPLMEKLVYLNATLPGVEVDILKHRGMHR